MTIALIVIGCLTGLLTGLTGASGMSILISGLLLAGMDIRAVIGLTFAVTFFNALSAIGPYLKKGNWDPRVTWTIGIPAAAAVFLGNQLGRAAPSHLLTLAIICALLGAGIKFLKGKKPNAEGKPPRETTPWLLLVLVGAIIGTLMGVMGGGGSIFITLLIVFGLRIPLMKALGSSIIIMGLAAIPGMFLNFSQGHLDLTQAVLLIVPGMVASVVGGKLANRIPERKVELVLGCYLVVISLVLTYSRLVA